MSGSRCREPLLWIALPFTLGRALDAGEEVLEVAIVLNFQCAVEQRYGLFVLPVADEGLGVSDEGRTLEAFDLRVRAEDIAIRVRALVSSAAAKSDDSLLI